MAFSLLTLIALMSNSSGRGNIFGEAVTGAPGDSNKTCGTSGCHSSGAFSPTPILSVFDQDGNEITNYKPGETYDVVLKVEAVDNPVEFGFQMVSLTDDNAPVNQWESIGSNVQLVKLGDRDYIEHNSPSSENEFSARWTAPSTGTGDVKFYFAVNAVNGNGSPSGDGAANSSFTLNETLSSSSDINNITFKIFPNPATDFITIDGVEDAYTYTMVDINGKTIIRGFGNDKTTVNTANLNPGLYFIILENNDIVKTQKLIIQ